MSAAKLETDILHQMMDSISAIAATAEGGVDRMALTEGDRQARNWLRAQFDQLGLRTVIDPIGNMFGCLDLVGHDGPWIMTGSHLDSQPSGGRFDGAYGVVAGLAAVSALQKAIASGALRPRANLAVVNWTNEEGARFQPSLIGSSVYAGALDLQEAYRIRDGSGSNLGEALTAIGYRGTAQGPRPSAYVEMHVECAPELEMNNLQAGPFCRYWGATKIRAAFKGAQAHTGPTPMAKRRDALLGAAYLIAELRALCDQSPDMLYTSVGRIEVLPNSPNSVISDATLYVELRSPDQATLEWAETNFEQALRLSAQRAAVNGRVLQVERRRAGVFDKSLCRLTEDVMQGEGIDGMRLATIAAHDGIRMAALCPSIVVAVRSIGGICHNAVEYSTPDDLEAGGRILVGMLSRLLTGS